MITDDTASAGLLSFAAEMDVHPFPQIVQDEVMPLAIYQELKQTMPALDKFGKAFRMQGDLTWGDETYTQLLKIDAWRQLHDYVYSETFMRQLVARFADSIDRYVGLGQLLLDPARISYDPKIEGRQPQRRISDNDRPDHWPLYTRLDIGYGLAGYGRKGGGGGVHIDNCSRLFSMLIYFNDPEDMVGGEFEVYERKNYLPRLLRRIDVAQNRAIVSLQTNEAYHAVNPVTEVRKPRFALYMAVASRNRLWRKIADPILALYTLNRFETHPIVRRMGDVIRMNTTPLLRRTA